MRGGIWSRTGDGIVLQGTKGQRLLLYNGSLSLSTHWIDQLRFATRSGFRMWTDCSEDS